MSEWVSVDDEYPVHRGDVLIHARCVDGKSLIGMGWFSRGNINKWNILSMQERDLPKTLEGGMAEITHWMPLPEPPE